MAEVSTLESSGRGGGIIGWFAHNHVAANLLMVIVIGAGIQAIMTMKKETMPTMSRNMVQVYVPYRGGTPEEVERGVLIKIEEAVRTVEGIDEVRSTAQEGSGMVRLNLTDKAEITTVMDDVKLAVDAISTFPGDIERPSIREYISQWRGIINVQVYGNIDEAALKEFTESLRLELLALPEVSYAEVQGTRPFEINIEIPDENLRQYGLSLGQVANIIRQWSVDLPGGGIRTEGGYVRVRAKGQAYTGLDYEKIVVLTNPDGTVVTLGAIANIKDGFTESENYSFFDGKRSFGIQIRAREQENSIEIAEAVRNYVDERKLTLPDSVQLAYFGDSTYYLSDRINMMVKNMIMGAVIVFLLLGLFLRLKIAAWVLVGLPVAFLGAFIALPHLDITINIVSLFGFIVVIGIVVDDAIIIAESAHAETEHRGYSIDSIVAGARRVAVPATFGVLTTVAAFAPMLFAGGRMTTFFSAIGWVVVLCLLFSLVESKLILPSHLALMKSSKGRRAGVADWTEKKLKSFIENKYQPFLRFALKNRYTTLAAFIAVFIITLGYFLSPFLSKDFFPSLENDFLFAEINMLEGTPESMIIDVVETVSDALDETNEEIKQLTGVETDSIKHVYAWSNGTRAQFNAELAKPEQRPMTPTEITNIWREKVGEIAGTDELTFRSTQGWGSGAPIAVNLTSKNPASLDAATHELEQHLRTFDGLYEIRTPTTEGPDELKLSVKPEGAALGLTLGSLARQVREAFFGAEAQRIQRGDSEVRVIVRYPLEQRQSIGNLEEMWIQLPDGTETHFHSVASYKMEPGYGYINRINGKRTASVSAEANRAIINPFEVMSEINSSFLPQLLSRYPDVDTQITGSWRDQAIALDEMLLAFCAALVLIYGLMAIPLKSYVQPLIIMSVIPFGLIGAVIGHVILGAEFNMVSGIGCIALTGVVVNDSLILVHYVNRKRREDGASLLAGILSAGKARLRAILLTSLTTFFGLVPILAEQSMQAKMVANMAISIAFGILFATVITLILVPCLLRIQGDIVGLKDADVLPSDALDTGELVPSVAGGN